MNLDHAFTVRTSKRSKLSLKKRCRELGLKEGLFCRAAVDYALTLPDEDVAQILIKKPKE